MAGTTLTDLVRRKGGVKDFGGELADMLGGKTVRKRSKTGKVFFAKSGRGIIRKRGRDLDDMRHIAIEEGFLPAGAGINDLLDALSDESRGRVRRSVQGEYVAPERVWIKPRKRKPEKPTIPGHSSLTKKCKRCGRLHGKSQHRFHGAGSYVGTHKFLKYFGENPMTVAKAKQYVDYYTGLIRHGMQLVKEERELLVRARQLMRKARHPGRNPARLRNSTSTRTEVRSPTSTRALTRGNTTLTITGNGNRIRVPMGVNPRKARTRAELEKRWARMRSDFKKPGGIWHGRYCEACKRVGPHVCKVKNPRGGVVIYHKLLRVEAQKGPGHRCDVACKRANHSYFHDFKAGAVVYGMPDGSLVVRSNNGKRLWNFF